MFESAHGDAAQLLGRLEEQSLLTSLLEDVAARGQALVLSGEPGIGKSRLLSMCERLARERGMAALSTTGVQSEAHLPFAGLHQLLRPVRDRASELRDVQRAALDAAFGLTDEAPPEHFRIAMAVLDLFSDVSAAAPLLVVVEDAHWLDRATSDVLRSVARRIESDPIVVLIAIREGYPSALGEVGLPEHKVVALDDTSAAALLDRSAPGLPAAARTRVLREAAGNPLAILELPAVIGRPGAEQWPAGSVPLTERLERAFADRVSDLPDATRLLLLVAALSDEDGLDEILQATGAVAGIAMDLDVAGPAVEAGVVNADLQTIRCIRSSDRRSRRAPAWRNVGVSMRRWPMWFTISPTVGHGTAPHCSRASMRTSPLNSCKQQHGHVGRARFRSRSPH